MTRQLSAVQEHLLLGDAAYLEAVWLVIVEIE